MSVVEHRGTPAIGLTGFQRDLLAAVAHEETAIGLEIKEILERHYGEVNHGRLYPNLDALVEHEFITKQPKSRRAFHYSITDEGRYALEQHADWLDGCLEGDEA